MIKRFAGRRPNVLGVVLMIAAVNASAAARGLSFGQGPRLASVHLEVSSVKPNLVPIGPNNPSSIRPTGNGVTVTNMPLRNVIIYAFGINPLYVAGVPAWGDSERYDIAVRATEQSTVTEQNRALVRSVLVERFRLKSHTERRTMPLYRAVLARSDRRLGEKLRPVTNAVECPNAGNGPAAAADTCRIVPTPGGFSGKAITVAEMLRIIGALGAQFGGVDSAALEDGTGLTGRFDVSLSFPRNRHLLRAPVLTRGRLIPRDRPQRSARPLRTS
jgi:uncharacterized protein (TIGR03435 family)